MSAVADKGMRHYQILWARPMSEGMNRAELVERKSMLAEAQSRLESIAMNCEFCLHLKVTTCVLFDDEVPPAFRKAKDNGCESWSYEPMPF